MQKKRILFTIFFFINFIQTQTDASLSEINFETCQQCECYKVQCAVIRNADIDCEDKYKQTCDRKRYYLRNEQCNSICDCCLEGQCKKWNDYYCFVYKTFEFFSGLFFLGTSLNILLLKILYEHYMNIKRKFNKQFFKKNIENKLGEKTKNPKKQKKLIKTYFYKFKKTFYIQREEKAQPTFLTDPRAKKVMGLFAKLELIKPLALKNYITLFLMLIMFNIVTGIGLYTFLTLNERPYDYGVYAPVLIILFMIYYILYFICNKKIDSYREQVNIVLDQFEQEHQCKIRIRREKKCFEINWNPAISMSKQKAKNKKPHSKAKIGKQLPLEQIKAEQLSFENISVDKRSSFKKDLQEGSEEEQSFKNSRIDIGNRKPKISKNKIVPKKQSDQTMSKFDDKTISQDQSKSKSKSRSRSKSKSNKIGNINVLKKQKEQQLIKFIDSNKLKYKMIKKAYVPGYFFIKINQKGQRLKYVSGNCLIAMYFMKRLIDLNPKIHKVQTNYDDLRFGIIDILVDEKESKLYMRKQKKSKDSEDYLLSQKISLKRLSLNHPNLLKMSNVESDDQNLIVNVYFDYPNEDLYDRKDQLKNTPEFVKFFNDIIAGLATLEKNKMVHGNLKPEYIYYDGENYVIKDRLADTSTPVEAQINNIKYGENLYQTPQMFETICSGKPFGKYNPFKEEVFNFGMLAFSLLIDNEEDLQKCYDTTTQKFNQQLFKDLVVKTKRKYFENEQDKIIGEFLFYGILNPNQTQRFSPRKAHLILKRSNNQNYQSITTTSEQEKGQSNQQITSMGQFYSEADFSVQNTVVNTANRLELKNKKKNQIEYEIDFEEEGHGVQQEDKIVKSIEKQNMSDGFNIIDNSGQHKINETVVQIQDQQNLKQSQDRVNKNSNKPNVMILKNKKRKNKEYEVIFEDNINENNINQDIELNSKKKQEEEMSFQFNDQDQSQEQNIQQQDINKKENNINQNNLDDKNMDDNKQQYKNEENKNENIDIQNQDFYLQKNNKDIEEENFINDNIIQKQEIQVNQKNSNNDYQNQNNDQNQQNKVNNQQNIDKNQNQENYNDSFKIQDKEQNQQNQNRNVENLNENQNNDFQNQDKDINIQQQNDNSENFNKNQNQENKDIKDVQIKNQQTNNFNLQNENDEQQQNNEIDKNQEQYYQEYLDKFEQIDQRDQDKDENKNTDSDFFQTIQFDKTRDSNPQVVKNNKEIHKDEQVNNNQDEDQNFFQPNLQIQQQDLQLEQQNSQKTQKLNSDKNSFEISSKTDFYQDQSISNVTRNYSHTNNDNISNITKNTKITKAPLKIDDPKITKKISSNQIISIDKIDDNENYQKNKANSIVNNKSQNIEDKNRLQSKTFHQKNNQVIYQQSIDLEGDVSDNQQDNQNNHDNNNEDNKNEDNKINDNKIDDNKNEDNKIEDNKINDNKNEDNKIDDNNNEDNTFFLKNTTKSNLKQNKVQQPNSKQDTRAMSFQHTRESKQYGDTQAFQFEDPNQQTFQATKEYDIKNIIQEDNEIQIDKQEEIQNKSEDNNIESIPKENENKKSFYEQNCQESDIKQDDVLQEDNLKDSVQSKQDSDIKDNSLQSYGSEDIQNQNEQIEQVQTRQISTNTQQINSFYDNLKNYQLQNAEKNQQENNQQTQDKQNNKIEVNPPQNIDNQNNPNKEQNNTQQQDSNKDLIQQQISQNIPSTPQNFKDQNQSTQQFNETSIQPINQVHQVNREFDNKIQQTVKDNKKQLQSDQNIQYSSQPNKKYTQDELAKLFKIQQEKKIKTETVINRNQYTYQQVQTKNSYQRNQPSKSPARKVTRISIEGRNITPSLQNKEKYNFQQIDRVQYKKDSLPLKQDYGLKYNKVSNKNPPQSFKSQRSKSYNKQLQISQASNQKQNTSNKYNYIPSNDHLKVSDTSFQNQSVQIQNSVQQNYPGSQYHRPSQFSQRQNNTSHQRNTQVRTNRSPSPNFRQIVQKNNVSRMVQQQNNQQDRYIKTQDNNNYQYQINSQKNKESIENLLKVQNDKFQLADSSYQRIRVIQTNYKIQIRQASIQKIKRQFHGQILVYKHEILNFQQSNYKKFLIYSKNFELVQHKFDNYIEFITTYYQTHFNISKYKTISEKMTVFTRRVEVNIDNNKVYNRYKRQSEGIQNQKQSIVTQQSIYQNNNDQNRIHVSNYSRQERSVDLKNKKKFGSKSPIRIKRITEEEYNQIKRTSHRSNIQNNSRRTVVKHPDLQKYKFVSNQSHQTQQQVQTNQNIQVKEDSINFSNIKGDLVQSKEIVTNKIYNPEEELILSQESIIQNSQYSLYNENKLRNSQYQNQIKRGPYKKIANIHYIKNIINEQGISESKTDLMEKFLPIHNNDLIHLKDENGMRIYKYNSKKYIFKKQIIINKEN